MSLTHSAPMVFIETIDEAVITAKSLVDVEKYDQLSQLDISWKVIFAKDDEYDADDEDENKITIKDL